MSLPSEPITRKEQYLAKAAGQAVEIPAEPITREEAYLDAIAKGSGGGGGTTNYNQLSNKPQINGVTLSGDKSASDLSLASLDANGKVPAAQLPSYVDDVINGYLYEGHFYEDSAHTTEITGESGKIYVDLETNKTYRWSGLAFVEVSESLALGETASTAYAGDKGKANADAIAAIKDGQGIDSFSDVETALADKVDKVQGKGLSTNDYDDTAKAIVDGVSTALNGKVDKVEGKGLSENDYTDSDKAIVDGVTAALALKQDATDNTLETTDKTVSGAINEVNSGVEDLQDWTDAETKSVTGNPITLTDAAAVKAKALSVSIDPVQDLHGYDHPWVGGAGKNKCFVTDKTIAGAGYVIDNANINDIGGLPVGTYAVSFDASGYASGGAYECILKDANGTNLASKSGSFSSERISFSLTIADVAARIVMYTNSSSGVSISNIQIESGETATSFAPYTNICPITGHTEASVQRDGKNLFNPVQENALHNKTIDENGDEITNQYWSASDYVGVKEEIAYSVRYTATNPGAYFYAVYYDSGFNFMQRNAVTVAEGYGVKTVHFTTVSGAKYVRLLIPKSNGTEYYDWSTVSMFEGNEISDEPYQGKTYTKQLGGTYYGFDLDFNTGVMTVDRSFVVYDGTQTVQNVQRIDNVVRGQFVIQNSAAYPHAISNYLEWVNDWSLDQPHFYIYDNKINVFLPIPNDGTSTWDSYLASNPLQVCYPLATPTTIQLTPQQIQLLKGTNTLTANGSSISLTYQPDNLVGEVMEQVEPQIDDLQEQIDEIPRLVDYSTTPQKTGQKWIDGKLIKRFVVVKENPVTLVHNNWTSLGITPPSDSVRAIGVVALRSDGITMMYCEINITSKAINIQQYSGENKEASIFIIDYISNESEV